MMEVGIFSKDLHEMEMINNGMADQIDLYDWVYLADGHEAVFEDSNQAIGRMALVGSNGELVELLILREWCNNFKPLSEF